MATNNATILEAAWLNGSNDYQQRVPQASTVGVDRVAKFLYEPYNRRYLNEFSSFLFGRIAQQYVHQKAWKNRLRFLKKDTMPYGMTIEETALKWVKAHSHNNNDIETETILKTHYPQGMSVFHSQNRKDVYEISVNHDDLRTGFNNETGLTDYVSAVMQVPINSDEYDEYRIMLQLFAKMHEYHGFYMEKIDMPNDEASARAMLKKLRAYGDRLQFPSTIFNMQDIVDIPTFVKPEELLLFVTPEINAALDVDGLAPIFHMEKADYKYRVIVVDEFPIPDVCAILTTADFFMVKDTVYETSEFYNPHSLTTNYYLNHWGVYSASPFVPLIAFTTAEQVEIPVIEFEVTGMTVTPPEKVIANDVNGALFAVDLEGTVSPETDCKVLDVKPDSAIFEVVSVTGADGDIVYTPFQVFFNDKGELYVLAFNNEELMDAIRDGACTITVKATSTYTNPSGETVKYEETLEVTPQLCDEENAGE